MGRGDAALFGAITIASGLKSVVIMCAALDGERPRNMTKPCRVTSEEGTLSRSIMKNGSGAL